METVSTVEWGTRSQLTTVWSNLIPTKDWDYYFSFAFVSHIFFVSVGVRVWKIDNDTGWYTITKGSNTLRRWGRGVWGGGTKLDNNVSDTNDDNHWTAEERPVMKMNKVIEYRNISSWQILTLNRS